jgi:hypothetical protein
VKERPILFSAPMVRAILAGTKTQTRRVVKPQPDGVTGATWLERDGLYFPCRDELCRGMLDAVGPGIKCPFGAPGDRLWVREAWHSCPHCPQHQPLGYMAYRAGGWRTGTARSDDDARPLPTKCAAHGYKPSIHMKRHASRIDLEVTGVRVERLQSISLDDAKAEGARRFAEGTLPPSFMGNKGPGWSMVDPKDFGHTLGSPQMAFANLWENINGADPAKAWAANPWVWVVEFRRLP